MFLLKSRNGQHRLKVKTIKQRNVNEVQRNEITVPY